MADQTKPDANTKAPDPATVYEGAKPEAESGQGRLDNNKSTPENSPDHVEDAVHNRHQHRQINAHDTPDKTISPRSHGDHREEN